MDPLRRVRLAFLPSDAAEAARGGAEIQGVPIRLSISFGMALGVTAGLFWFLWVLIAAREEGAVIAAIPRIDFSRLRHDTELQEVKRVKPQIDKPRPPPASPTVSASKAVSVTAGVDASSLAPSAVDFSGVAGGGLAGGVGASLGFGAGADRDAVPQVRIEPEYPPGARARRIEGWVTVRFDVAADGSTRNIVVVESKPARLFDRETLRAVGGWKYSPKIQDGKPVERKGIQMRIVFELDG